MPSPEMSNLIYEGDSAPAPRCVAGLALTSALFRNTLHNHSSYTRHPHRLLDSRILHHTFPDHSVPSDQSDLSPSYKIPEKEKLL